MVGVAIVASLGLVSVRGREGLSRGITVLTVHVGHWCARYTAGVEQDAHDSVRMEARSSGSESDDFRDTRIAVVVGDHCRSYGPEVVGHGAFVVDKGNREPARAEVPR